jgi:ABC-type transport system involved in cytochrome c biogenesis ATPase subunit
MFTAESVSGNGSTPAIAGEPVVDVAEVTKRYAHRTAIANLTLAVRPGEVLGLVGANGGGKTTALRILAGVLKPDEGQGQVLGFDLRRDADFIREHVGYMSQRSSFYADLSVFENLRFRAEVYGLDRPKVAVEAAILDFGLTEYARIAAGRHNRYDSGGERDRCGQATLRFAAERRHYRAAFGGAFVFCRPSDSGIRLLGFSRQPTSGNPGCRVFLSSVDALVGLYVPV